MMRLQTLLRNRKDIENQEDELSYADLRLWTSRREAQRGQNRIN
nr:hypothetical protein [Desulforamulus aquiferis]